MKARWRNILAILAIFLVAAIVVYTFRISIMEAAAKFLIQENAPQQCEVAFVLGGDSHQRGLKAVQLYKEGFVNKIACTGTNVPRILPALGITFTEAQITARLLQLNGVPDSVIIIIKKPVTSTIEEAVAIQDYCLENELNNIILVTGKFHTRRVSNVLGPALLNNNIRYMLVGCDNLTFDELQWWKSEEGMIALNNEYMKHLYYWLKY